MAAEVGHVPNIAYFGQDGIFHLNGMKIADANEVTTDLTTSTGTDAGSNGLQRKGVCRTTFDFAVDGGAVSTITPAVSVALPAKAVITRAWAHVLTGFTGGAGATLAINLEGAGDMRVAATLATGGLNTTGYKELIQDGTAATFIQTSVATRKIAFTVAVNALTAGKCVVIAEYVVTG